MTKRLESSPDCDSLPLANRSRVEKSVVHSQDEMDTCTGITMAEAEVGIIEEMKLINFMCHRRLTIRFSPNVNVIVGRNGSGKSAIMTAIVVALGGTARNTERGSSLKQFIRTGEQFAEVVISLRNSGVEAFKPDKYGKRFTVVRCIKQDGTGSYEIKGANGKKISTSKEELVHFLEHCGIQINNPVSILHQDTSRNFLHSSSPAARYELFMKATRLEQMDVDYDKCKEEQKLMCDSIEQKKKFMLILEAKALDLQDRVEYFEKLQEKQRKLEELERESSWAKVIEIEQLIGPAEEKIKCGQERVAKYEQKVKKAKSYAIQEKDKQKKVTNELKQAMQEASEAKNSLEAIGSEVRTKERELHVLKKEVHQIHRQINDVNSEKSALQRVMNEKIAASQRDRDGERETVLHQLKHHQEQLKRLESEIAAAKNEQSELDNAISTCKTEIQTHLKHVRSKEAIVESSEKHLRRLQTSQSDRLSVFGTRMRLLVDTLQKNCRRFRYPPKGPIGAMINLKDYRWSCAVEQAIKRSILHAFVVDNEHDAAIFKQIVRSVYSSGIKPECITSRFSDQVYDVSRNRPCCVYPTIVEVLDVREPDIVNLLIDQCSVESVLLIERGEGARNVMVHQRPKGARAAWTIDGDEVLSYAYYSNKRGRFGIIQSSVEETIREEKFKLVQLQSSLDQLKENDYKDHLQRSERELGQIKQQIKRKIEEKNKHEQQIVEVRNVQEEMESKVEDMATYEAEIRESEDLIKTLVKSREDKLGSLNELEQARIRCLAHREHGQNELCGATENLEKARDCLNDQSHVCNQAECKLQSSKNRLKEVQDAVKKLELELGDIRQKAHMTVQSAIGERIETDRSRLDITREIQSIKRFLHEQPSMEEQEAEQDRYIEAMERWTNTKKQIENARTGLSALKSGLESRTKNYEMFKHRIIAIAQLCFLHFLQVREFIGKLQFSHKSGKGHLDVIVGSDRNSQSTTKDLKCLSGGERSFATVCFIMSLWDAIEAPFRCLDEFDVYMDMKNRQASMKLMIEHAISQPHRQFTFFTPSSMDISTSTKVKVHKLHDPDHGQSTLD